MTQTLMHPLRFEYAGKRDPETGGSEAPPILATDVFVENPAGSHRGIDVVYAPRDDFEPWVFQDSGPKNLVVDRLEANTLVIDEAVQVGILNLTGNRIILNSDFEGPADSAENVSLTVNRGYDEIVAGTALIPGTEYVILETGSQNAAGWNRVFSKSGGDNLTAASDIDKYSVVKLKSGQANGFNNTFGTAKLALAYDSDFDREIRWNELIGETNNTHGKWQFTNDGTNYINMDDPYGRPFASFASGANGANKIELPHKDIVLHSKLTSSDDPANVKISVKKGDFTGSDPYIQWTRGPGDDDLANSKWRFSNDGDEAFDFVKPTDVVIKASDKSNANLTAETIQGADQIWIEDNGVMKRIRRSEFLKNYLHADIIAEDNKYVRVNSGGTGLSFVDRPHAVDGNIWGQEIVLDAGNETGTARNVDIIVNQGSNFAPSSRLTAGEKYRITQTGNAALSVWQTVFTKADDDILTAADIEVGDVVKVKTGQENGFASGFEATENDWSSIGGSITATAFVLRTGTISTHNTFEANSNDNFSEIVFGEGAEAWQAGATEITAGASTQLMNGTTYMITALGTGGALSSWAALGLQGASSVGAVFTTIDAGPLPFTDTNYGDGSKVAEVSIIAAGNSSFVSGRQYTVKTLGTKRARLEFAERPGIRWDVTAGKLKFSNTGDVGSFKDFISLDDIDPLAHKNNTDRWLETKLPQNVLYGKASNPADGPTSGIDEYPDVLTERLIPVSGLAADQTGVTVTTNTGGSYASALLRTVPVANLPDITTAKITDIPDASTSPTAADSQNQYLLRAARATAYSVGTGIPASDLTGKIEIARFPTLTTDNISNMPDAAARTASDRAGIMLKLKNDESGYEFGKVPYAEVEGLPALPNTAVPVGTPRRDGLVLNTAGNALQFAKVMLYPGDMRSGFPQALNRVENASNSYEISLTGDVKLNHLNVFESAQHSTVIINNSRGNVDDVIGFFAEQSGGITIEFPAENIPTQILSKGESLLLVKIGDIANENSTRDIWIPVSSSNDRNDRYPAVEALSISGSELLFSTGNFGLLNKIVDINCTQNATLTLPAETGAPGTSMLLRNTTTDFTISLRATRNSQQITILGLGNTEIKPNQSVEVIRVNTGNNANWFTLHQTPPKSLTLDSLTVTNLTVAGTSGGTLVPTGAGSGLVLGWDSTTNAIGWVTAGSSSQTVQPFIGNLTQTALTLNYNQSSLNGDARFVIDRGTGNNDAELRWLNSGNKFQIRDVSNNDYWDVLHTGSNLAAGKITTGQISGDRLSGSVAILKTHLSNKSGKVPVVNNSHNGFNYYNFRPVFGNDPATNHQAIALSSQTMTLGSAHTDYIGKKLNVTPTAAGRTLALSTAFKSLEPEGNNVLVYNASSTYSFALSGVVFPGSAENITVQPKTYVWVEYINGRWEMRNIFRTDINQVPAGGSTDEVLTKTSSGYGWAPARSTAVAGVSSISAVANSGISVVDGNSATPEIGLTTLLTGTGNVNSVANIPNDAYGESGYVPQITVDAQGRVTNIQNRALSLTSSLADLTDTEIETASSITEQEILSWDATNDEWKNRTFAEAGIVPSLSFINPVLRGDRADDTPTGWTNATNTYIVQPDDWNKIIAADTRTVDGDINIILPDYHAANYPIGFFCHILKDSHSDGQIVVRAGNGAAIIGRDDSSDYITRGSYASHLHYAQNNTDGDYFTLDDVKDIVTVYVANIQGWWGILGGRKRATEVPHSGTGILVRASANARAAFATTIDTGYISDIPKPPSVSDTQPRYLQVATGATSYTLPSSGGIPTSHLVGRITAAQLPSTVPTGWGPGTQQNPAPAFSGNLNESILTLNADANNEPADTQDLRIDFNRSQLTNWKTASIVWDENPGKFVFRLPVTANTDRGVLSRSGQFLKDYDILHSGSTLAIDKLSGTLATGKGGTGRTDGSNLVPAGGVNDAVLRKTGTGDYALAWETIREVPNTGTGVLKRNSAGQVTFSTIASADLPNINLTNKVTGTLPVSSGGTGATSAANARTSLGIGAIGTLSSISLTNLPTISVAKGGTGATTATTARSNLGIGTLGTLSSIALTDSKLTGTLSIAKGGTGRTDGSNLIPTGGTNDQVLRKTSSSNYAFGWESIREVPTYPTQNRKTHFLAGDGTWKRPATNVVSATTSVSISNKNSYVYVNDGGSGRTITLPNATNSSLSDGDFYHFIFESDRDDAGPLTIASASGTSQLRVSGNDASASSYAVPSGGFNSVVSIRFVMYNDNWYPVGQFMNNRGHFSATGNATLRHGSLHEITGTSNATLTLPETNRHTRGSEILVVKSGSGTDTITFQRTGGDTINGTSSKSISMKQYDWVRFISDESRWFMEPKSSGSGIDDWEHVSVSSNQNIPTTANNRIYEVSTSSGNRTMTLPSNPAENFYIIFQKNSNNNTLTIRPGSGDQINGSTGGISVTGNRDTVHVRSRGSSGWVAWIDYAVTPIVNGGTGSSTASGARSNLGLGSLATASSVGLNTTNTTGTLPISKGGTGGTTLTTGRRGLRIPIYSSATTDAGVATSTEAIWEPQVDYVTFRKGNSADTADCGFRVEQGTNQHAHLFYRRTDGIWCISNEGLGDTGGQVQIIHQGNLATNNAVARGGTGANNARSARNNLDAEHRSSVAAGWSGSLTANLNEDDNKIISFNTSGGNRTYTMQTNARVGWTARVFKETDDTNWVRLQVGSGHTIIGASSRDDIVDATQDYVQLDDIGDYVEMIYRGGSQWEVMHARLKRFEKSGPQYPKLVATKNVATISQSIPEIAADHVIEAHKTYGIVITTEYGNISRNPESTSEMRIFLGSEILSWTQVTENVIISSGTYSNAKFGTVHHTHRRGGSNENDGIYYSLGRTSDNKIAIWNESSTISERAKPIPFRLYELPISSTLVATKNNFSSLIQSTPQIAVDHVIEPFKVYGIVISAEHNDLSSNAESTSEMRIFLGSEILGWTSVSTGSAIPSGTYAKAKFGTVHHTVNIDGSHGSVFYSMGRTNENKIAIWGELSFSSGRPKPNPFRLYELGISPPKLVDRKIAGSMTRKTPQLASDQFIDPNEIYGMVITTEFDDLSNVNAESTSEMRIFLGSEILSWTQVPIGNDISSNLSGKYGTVFHLDNVDGETSNAFYSFGSTDKEKIAIWGDSIEWDQREEPNPFRLYEIRM